MSEKKNSDFKMFAESAMQYRFHKLKHHAKKSTE